MSNLSKISYKNPSFLTIFLTVPFIFGCTNTASVDANSAVDTDGSVQTDTNITSEKIAKTDVNENSIDCQQTDTALAKSLKMSAENATNSKIDAVNAANIEFKETLTNYTQQAGSMQCDFPLASAEGLWMISSDDKNLRIFTWDENTGGSMRNYAGLHQFKDAQDKLYAQDIQSSGIYAKHSLPNALYTAVLDGKATYMLASTGVYSGKDRHENLNLFTINGNKLERANIIRTKTITYSLSFRYDYFSVVDGPERSAELFEYDNQTKTIRFPVVVDDEKYPSGKVTDTFIKYRFDGTYFHRVKN